MLFSSFFLVVVPENKFPAEADLKLFAVWMFAACVGDEQNLPWKNFPSKGCFHLCVSFDSLCFIAKASDQLLHLVDVTSKSEEGRSLFLVLSFHVQNKLRLISQVEVAAEVVWRIRYRSSSRSRKRSINWSRSKHRRTTKIYRSCSRYGESCK